VDVRAKKDTTMGDKKRNKETNNDTPTKPAMKKMKGTNITDHFTKKSKKNNKKWRKNGPKQGLEVIVGADVAAAITADEKSAGQDDDTSMHEQIELLTQQEERSEDADELDDDHGVRPRHDDKQENPDVVDWAKASDETDDDGQEDEMDIKEKESDSEEGSESDEEEETDEDENKAAEQDVDVDEEGDEDEEYDSIADKGWDDSSVATVKAGEAKVNERGYNTRYSIRLEYDGCTGDQGPFDMAKKQFVYLMKTIHKEDEKALIHPWTADDANRSPLKTVEDIKSLKPSEARIYFHRFYAVDNGGDLNFDIFVGHDTSVEDLISGFRMQVPRGRGALPKAGMWLQAIQDEDVARLGWLLYSGPQTEIAPLQTEITERAGCPIALRFRTIALPTRKGMRGHIPEREQVKAIHIEAHGHEAE